MFFSSQEVIQCVHLGAVTNVYALSPAVYDVNHPPEDTGQGDLRTCNETQHKRLVKCIRKRQCETVKVPDVAFKRGKKSTRQCHGS